MSETQDKAGNGESPIEAAHRAARDEQLPRLRSRDVVSSFFNDVLELDLPILRTIIDMTLRPGRLCRAYLSGYRRRFSNPMRYAFLMAAVMALVYAVMGTSPSAVIEQMVQPPTIVVTDGEAPADSTTGETPNESPTDTNAADETGPPANASDAESVDGATEEDASEEARRRTREQLQQHAEWMQGQVRANQHYLAFFMLPLFALLMKLFFRRAGFNFAEHYAIILFIYGQSFFFHALFGLVSLTTTVLGIVSTMFLLAVYETWAVHQVYGEGWVRTILKMIALKVLQTIASGLLGFVVGAAIFIGRILFN